MSRKRPCQGLFGSRTSSATYTPLRAPAGCGGGLAPARVKNARRSATLCSFFWRNHSNTCDSFRRSVPAAIRTRSRLFRQQRSDTWASLPFKAFCIKRLPILYHPWPRVLSAPLHVPASASTETAHTARRFSAVSLSPTNAVQRQKRFVSPGSQIHVVFAGLT